MHAVSARPAQPQISDICLDVGGFALGIGLALLLGWNTSDLVWGLWLSSLVIGYAAIVAGIVRADSGAGGFATLAAKLALVAFFSVHFGLFHLVHSVFLNLFFPLAGDGGHKAFLVDYRDVFASYWPWLPAAAIAERRTLLAPFVPAATGVAQATAVGLRGFNPMQAYVNVVRMHLLIFFFLAASLLGLGGFWVYLVVYAVYFWPWRKAPRLGRADAPAAGG